MEHISNFLRTDLFLVLLLILNIILLISSIISNIRIKNVRKNYKTFINKLGNGKNIDEDLEKYMNRVITLEEMTRNLSRYYKELDINLQKCIQKIGIVRYNAYKDTGSDLSFTLALLNEENSGVVLNGIYSREMSNIYAKPIERGISRYTMTQEEKEAVRQAMNENIVKKVY